MADVVSVAFDAQDAFAGLDELQAAAQVAVRPAAQAGAQFFYERVRANVAAIGRVTGNLQRAVYQVYSKDNSTDGQRATYHVSWNFRTAPHGFLVEYGHVQTRVTFLDDDGNWVTTKTPLKTPRRVGARPFLRPAYDSAQAVALQAAQDKFNETVRANARAVS